MCDLELLKSEKYNPFKMYVLYYSNARLEKCQTLSAMMTVMAFVVEPIPKTVLSLVSIFSSISLKYKKFMTVLSYGTHIMIL